MFSSGIAHLSYEKEPSSNNSWRFEVTRIAATIDASLRDSLVALAEWRVPFPAYKVSEARSLYAITSQDNPWGIKGIKMKGAGGTRLNVESGNWECYRPRPEEKYQAPISLLVELDEKLCTNVRSLTPTALNSMTLQSAENEYVCQNQLASHGLGLPALIAGRFLHPESNEPLKDLFGRETGAVFVSLDPQIEPLSNLMRFSSAKLETVTTDSFDFHGGIERFISLSSKIATAKIDSIVQAGIVGHSGHYDNFLFDASSQKVLVSDVAGCQMLHVLPNNLRGPKLLMDLGSETLRMISELSYRAFSDSFTQDLERGKWKPFLALFEGFFKEHSLQSDIEEQSRALQAAYLQFAAKKAARLNQIFNSRVESSDSSFDSPASQTASKLWYLEHVAFVPLCLEAIFQLMRRSSLFNLGFTLPELPTGERQNAFSSGIYNYIQAVNQVILQTGSCPSLNLAGE